MASSHSPSPKATTDSNVVDKDNNTGSEKGSNNTVVSLSPFNCFVCHIDLTKNPNKAMDKSRYSDSLYAAMFNNLSKTLGTKDSGKQRILELTEEKAKKTISYCVPCQDEALQLYRLCTSDRSDESTLQQITAIKKLLVFRFTFGKRKNSKLQTLLKCIADPSQYTIPGYWYLRMAEIDCAEQMYNQPKLNEVLSKMNIEKLKKKPEDDIDESLYFMVPFPGQSTTTGSSSSKKSKTPSPPPVESDRVRFSEPEEDEDDNSETISERIAPIHLIKANMENQFSKIIEVVRLDNSTSIDIDEQLPIINWQKSNSNAENNVVDTGIKEVDGDSPTPIPEIKPPRKQVLASRVGVSSKQPVLKAIK